MKDKTVKGEKHKEPYSTEEDLIIMTGIRHSNSLNRPGTVIEVRKPINVPEFLSGSYSKISGLYDELQRIVMSLESKIDEVIEREEKEFLSAYKTHLVKVQNELNLYKAKLDEREYKLKHDHLLVSLRQSLDFFKKETVRLAECVSAQKNQLEKERMSKESLQKENLFLEKQLKKSKQENKLLQRSIKRTEQELNSRTQSEERSKSISGTLGRSLFRQQDTQFTEFLKCLKLIKANKEHVIEYCEKYFQELILRHEEALASLKQQLESEKRVSHKLRIAQTEPLISRTELEQLFYDCAEEVKRNTINRKAKYLSKMKHNRTMYVVGKEDTCYLLGSDKIRIMEQFMCNEKLLKQLYQLIFPAPKSTGSEIQVDIKDNLFEYPDKEGLYKHRRSSTGKGRSKYRVKDGKLCIG